MKPSSVEKALLKCIAAQRPAFVWGPPGVGKSALMHRIADQLGFKLFDFRALLHDPVDLGGMMIVVDGKPQWAPSPLIPTKGKWLIFLDELNAAPPLVQAGCYQLVLDRKVGATELSKESVIVAAGNREGDRAVTNRMPSALANRFVHLQFDVDVEDWVQWALQQDLMTEVIAFIRLRPELLHKFDPAKNDKAFPTPRSWEFVSDLLKTGSGSEVEFDLISGTVGEGAAAELIGFLKVFRNMPDPDMVLMSPDKAKVPTDPASLYAICGAIARKASEQNMGQVVKYANRLPEEYSVLMVRDCLRRDGELAKLRPFVEWATAHRSVLV